ncbi:MAG: hypothetical protein EHM80_16160, partial [Nitrospiraceae bacterium]
MWDKIWHTESRASNCHIYSLVCQYGRFTATLTSIHCLDSHAFVIYIESMISAADLKQGLKCLRFGERIHTFEKIDSTNTFARSLAAGGAAEGTLVVAEEQTAGKGRQGRRWLANPGENLTFSL